MPLIQEHTDALPYIDTPLSASERQLLTEQIRASLPPEASSTLHASIPDLPETDFSPALQAEFARLSANEKYEPNQRVDLSRYEELEPPVPTDPTTDETHPELLAQWDDTLKKSYTSSAYLQARQTNLSLLESFGKNAWLVSNSQQEAILRDLEVELARVKNEVQAVEQERRTRQEGVRGEMEGLEQAWRRGVGRVVETEVAAEGLRREVLERRRHGAA